jgi:ribosomal protein L40E
MYICTREGCKTNNPDDANFCRNCGTSFDLNTQLKLKYQSTVKLNSYNGLYSQFLLCSVVILPFYFYSPISRLNSHTDGRLAEYIERDKHLVMIGLLLLLFFSILITCHIKSIRKKDKKLRDIASVLEVTTKREKIIAKAGKYGLYDWKKRVVLIPVEYNTIEQMQNELFYKIGKANKQGIYSCSLNKIIVPCEFETVSQFRNGKAILTNGDITNKTDMQGNIF